MSTTAVRSSLVLSLSLLIAAAGCAPSSGDTLEKGPLSHLSAQGKGDALPATMTAAERQGKADGNDPREDYPEAYGFTNAPATASTLPGEFEPIKSLYIGWGSGAWELEQFFLDLIKEASSETSVTIIVPDQSTMNSLDDDMSRSGIDASRVSYLLYGVDTIWMRDYGPLATFTSGGSMNVVDPRYYYGRWMDDYYPTAWASSISESVSRPAIEMEGGNIQSDGQGSCVATEAHVERNAVFGYTESDIKNLFADYYGCANTTLVPQMAGEGTGHVDMSVHITGPKAAIVGEYDENDDPENHDRLEETARRLQADGFTVRRVHMPNNDQQSVFRSYTNALAVNGKVLIPVYPSDTRFDAEALRVFGEAYPGKQLVTIDSDDIIQWAGAIHCVTMTIAN